MHGPSRAERRNAERHRPKTPDEPKRFVTWRETVAAQANKRANLAGRASLANGAREAAAKAIVHARALGQPVHVFAAKAMLEFYMTEAKYTRAMSRIVRELRSQVAAA